MRKIKFKAWDTVEKRMIRMSEIEDNKLTYRELFSCAVSPRYILLQFIGLEGSEGNELCEGDIIEENKRFYVITYDAPKYYKACLCCSDPVVSSELDEGDNIVGNKFENPELLKKGE